MNVYIYSYAVFCAAKVNYLYIYNVNLEAGYPYTTFYDLKYILLFTVRGHPVNGQRTQRLYYIHWFIFLFHLVISVIKSHDKGQSIIQIGLALTEKAYSGIQYILFHFRPHWRGWRPLVTPWAWCIKEGIEPRILQKWFFPSHAQVSVPLCSPLLLLSCLCFYCSYCYYYYYYYYEDMLEKGFIIIAVVFGDKPGPYYSNDYSNKPGH